MLRPVYIIIINKIILYIIRGHEYVVNFQLKIEIARLF